VKTGQSSVELELVWEDRSGSVELELVWKDRSR